MNLLKEKVNLYWCIAKRTSLLSISHASAKHFGAIVVVDAPFIMTIKHQIGIIIMKMSNPLKTEQCQQTIQMTTIPKTIFELLEN